MIIYLILNFTSWLWDKPIDEKAASFFMILSGFETLAELLVVVFGIICLIENKRG